METRKDSASGGRAGQCELATGFGNRHAHKVDVRDGRAAGTTLSRRVRRPWRLAKEGTQVVIEKQPLRVELPPESEKVVCSLIAIE